MRIRRAEARDLPSILAIEKASFSRDLAFPAETVSFLLDEATTLVAEDGDLAGFVMGFVSGEVGKVVTLDVLPERRGKGIGRRLLEALEEEFESSGASFSLLEVAAESRGAVALYAKLGYAKAAILEGYYETGKDAFLMMKRLESSFQTTKYIDE
ncbi:MAG TPA: GNAT family N-acetyltransferase [Methanothrix sp.]|nr:GNAT family N-acetyltransferase [Methanothrix sp.]HPR65818.1 GNAT family N-acetyltransferase [Methanothrix sp.]